MQISGAATGTVLATETASSFNSGAYVDFLVSGNLNITITCQGGANAVLSGLFLDPPSALAPRVTGETPGSNTTGVATNSAVTVTFNEAMLASSITAGDFTLKSASGSSMTATVSYNSTTDTATLTPSSNLSNSTNYTASISGAEDSSGTPMSGTVSWSFTTGPAPAVTSESPASGATRGGDEHGLTATFNEAVQAEHDQLHADQQLGDVGAGHRVVQFTTTFVATLTPNASPVQFDNVHGEGQRGRGRRGRPMAAPFTGRSPPPRRPPQPLPTRPPPRHRGGDQHRGDGDVQRGDACLLDHDQQLHAQEQLGEHRGGDRLLKQHHGHGHAYPVVAC